MLKELVRRMGVLRSGLWIMLGILVFSQVLTIGSMLLFKMPHMGFAVSLAFICPLFIATPVLYYLLHLVSRIDKSQIELEAINRRLEAATEKVKELSGLLPMCSACKRIRDDKGYWNEIEVYIEKHSKAEFSHGICPDCARKLYPEHYGKGKPAS
jgi:hypothetical protein